jgi:endonuclease YncB( thermonuclease family)
MKVTSSFLIALIIMPSASAAQSRQTGLPKQIYGKAQVVDGSTFQFLETKQFVRLAGFVAPGMEQTAHSNGVAWPAGQVSRAWMILRTLGHDVNCAPIGRDQNQVLLAHCFVGDVNLAATAIAEGIGYAFSYRGEPQISAYIDIERRARGLGFGVWSSPDLPLPWLSSTLMPERSEAGQDRTIDLPDGKPIAAVNHSYGG